MQCVCVNCKLKTKHIPSPYGQQIARILLSSSKYTPCTILSAEHAPMPNPFITITGFRLHGCGPVAVCPGSRTTYSDGRDAHPILTLARSDAFLLSSTETNKPIGGQKMVHLESLYRLGMNIRPKLHFRRAGLLDVFLQNNSKGIYFRKLKTVGSNSTRGKSVQKFTTWY